MYRYLGLLPLLLLVGCGGGDGADDSTPEVDGVTADSAPPGGDADGASVDGRSTDGAFADGAAHVVTPTADDSQERAKVGEMDMPKLMEALGDATLSDAASDELLSRGGDAVKPLIAALDDEDALTQQRAVFTLGRLGPAASDALPKLKELAAQSNSEVVQDSARFAIDAIEGG